MEKCLEHVVNMRLKLTRVYTDKDQNICVAKSFEKSKDETQSYDPPLVFKACSDGSLFSDGGIFLPISLFSIMSRHFSGLPSFLSVRQ